MSPSVIAVGGVFSSAVAFLFKWRACSKARFMLDVHCANIILQFPFVGKRPLERTSLKLSSVSRPCYFSLFLVSIVFRTNIDGQTILLETPMSGSVA